MPERSTIPDFKWAVQRRWELGCAYDAGSIRERMEVHFRDSTGRMEWAHVKEKVDGGVIVAAGEYKFLKHEDISRMRGFRLTQQQIEDRAKELESEWSAMPPGAREDILENC